MKAKWFNLILITALLVITIVPVVGAAPPPPVEDLGPLIASSEDDAPHPLGTEQREAKATAIEAKLHGKSDGDNNHRSHRVSRRHYVELERLGEDTIWTILAEFGNTIHPVTLGDPGPVRNQIPEPDRSVDNTTIWAPDFNKAYYEGMLFSEAPGAVSMRNYYIEQSSNRYAVNGHVTDWVQVPYNEARYGTNICGGIVCSTVWAFVRDGAQAWYDSQIAAGKTPAEVDAYLSQFDIWDRYDYDEDGDFNESDGYIDHFQIVHAGEGEETGGGAQGEDAIWSHRWYAYYTGIGSTGPAFNPLGGTQVGGSSYWIGDYTVEPENGGVGVFAHEFGHDLGLPDLYDTSGNTGGAENSTGFWTLYSSGSYGSSGKPEDGIGTKPTHMSAYEKLFLGWSNYHAVNYNQKTQVMLGPAEYNTKKTQQLIVLLPDKEVNSFIGDPYAGSYFYHSGSGNDLDNSMTRDVTLPAGTVSLTAQVRYEIELDWDYAYLTVNGTPVATNLSTTENPNGQNFGEGITGSSEGAWVPLTADLSAFAGQTVTLGFRYWTDGAVAESGFSVDDIAITGLPTDDAETEPGWAYAGFIRTTGTVVESFANFYIAEYRQYEGYDRSLKTGPYNFGFLDTKPNWVEHFPYQDGLLVWYLDYSFPDNNVGDHCADGRCGGFFLPVDAHPELLLRPDNGQVWRPRIQSYDSTFGTQKTDKICLHVNTTYEQCYGGLKANPLFDDTQSYWFAPDPSIGHQGWASVPLPGFGVKIRVVNMSNLPGGFMTVKINK
ncbi:MAG TPA: immune inhibitor A domain-containing protein [Anaerolineales bacterium]|nr:immune inhibitor A domain-containing protein [Anaerolineales bacterium]